MSLYKRGGKTGLKKTTLDRGPACEFKHELNLPLVMIQIGQSEIRKKQGAFCFSRTGNDNVDLGRGESKIPHWRETLTKEDQARPRFFSHYYVERKRMGAQTGRREWEDSTNVLLLGSPQPETKRAVWADPIENTLCATPEWL